MSILDSRQGYWQERKNQWLAILKDTERGESREGAIGYGDALRYHKQYRETRAFREEMGISFAEWIEKYATEEDKAEMAKEVAANGVSLFDPVLAECMCRWFMPEPGGRIVDPMAGDTRKGLVFGYCGYKFTGIELRKEQVEANARMIEDRGLDIKYICDDGRNILNHLDKVSNNRVIGRVRLTPNIRYDYDSKAIVLECFPRITERLADYIHKGIVGLSI